MHIHKLSTRLPVLPSHCTAERRATQAALAMYQRVYGCIRLLCALVCGRAVMFGAVQDAAEREGAVKELETLMRMRQDIVMWNVSESGKKISSATSLTALKNRRTWGRAGASGKVVVSSLPKSSISASDDDQGSLEGMMKPILPSSIVDEVKISLLLLHDEDVFDRLRSVVPQLNVQSMKKLSEKRLNRLRSVYERDPSVKRSTMHAVHTLLFLSLFPMIIQGMEKKRMEILEEGSDIDVDSLDFSSVDLSIGEIIWISEQIMHMCSWSNDGIDIVGDKDVLMRIDKNGLVVKPKKGEEKVEKKPEKLMDEKLETSESTQKDEKKQDSTM
eukprot:gnl/Carplike_NY0171/4572_a6215_293.p1 GENE.gnl/Carplike_NY0171/4572_a6215_293~~gnl/Carplike_NY0171/4572_a6215_293.p1  ORF type:complete len:348 (+),score=110.26 gnl/Carplike_NY0171/4572_a6215_293:56-1045(+)